MRCRYTATYTLSADGGRASHTHRGTVTASDTVSCLAAAHREASAALRPADWISMSVVLVRGVPTPTDAQRTLRLTGASDIAPRPTPAFSLAGLCVDLPPGPYEKNPAPVGTGAGLDESQHLE
jgi:hypothetical protein